jgi:3-phenylpropionate/cinnamic acid dioxygenase small subunit
MVNAVMDREDQNQAAEVRRMLKHHRVEQFYALESELLDERRFDEWLELLSEDLHYWMPLARNFRHSEPVEEYTRARSEAAWFDEDKKTLRQRVQQIQGGDHWAEEPRSRTTHLVGGIRVAEEDGDTLLVKSRFVVYLNRAEREVQLFAGKRHDLLAARAAGFLVMKRSIFLDQHVLMAKSVTTFF